MAERLTGEDALAADRILLEADSSPATATVSNGVDEVVRATLEPADERVGNMAGGRADAETSAGALILDQVARFLTRFVRFTSDAQADAVTLWTAHTHAIDAFETSPRLAIVSVEKMSGKTRLLELLNLLTPRPQLTLNASVAAIFRLIAKDKPTLLFDEVDAIFGAKQAGHFEELRALLNAGRRRGASIPRCVGERHEVRNFPCFAAVALAGIGDLPDPVMSRSVVIRMKRRAPDEAVEHFRDRTGRRMATPLRDALGKWTADLTKQLTAMVPSMPTSITDRAADTWEPLLAVADAAGGDWPRRGRDAAVALAAAAAVDDGSLGVRLLRDIGAVFEHARIDQMPSADLAAKLVELEEAPWGDLYGRALDPRGLARRLKPYGITPKGMRVGPSTLRGYLVADFKDAWSRYAGSVPEADRNTATDLGAAGGNCLPENDNSGVAAVALSAGGSDTSPSPPTSDTEAISTDVDVIPVGQNPATAAILDAFPGSRLTGSHSKVPSSTAT